MRMENLKDDWKKRRRDLKEKIKLKNNWNPRVFDMGQIDEDELNAYGQQSDY